MRWSSNRLFQPVLPIATSEDWNLITRPVIPLFVSQPHSDEENAFHAHRSNASGDTAFFPLVSPTSKLVGGRLLGARDAAAPRPARPRTAEPVRSPAKQIGVVGSRIVRSTKSPGPTPRAALETRSRRARALHAKRWALSGIAMQDAHPVPVWLRAAGIVSIAAIAAGAAYAIAIALSNFARIGV